MQILVDLMNRGSLALVLVSSYHSSSLNHWITLTAHIAQQNKAHLSPQQEQRLLNQVHPLGRLQQACRLGMLLLSLVRAMGLMQLTPATLAVCMRHEPAARLQHENSNVNINHPDIWINFFAVVLILKTPSQLSHQTTRSSQVRPILYIIM